MLVGLLIGEGNSGMFWTFTFAFAIVGLFWTSVIAVPVLVFTEVKKVSSWHFYVLACAICAPTFFWALGTGLGTYLIPIGFSGAVAGATYWVLAWRLFPPSPIGDTGDDEGAFL
ncbi:MAG: hypothetical protein MK098_15640 [Marinovum sp.]|nr:hypothetical protein [Marinovum sp.]